ncbi:putative nicotinate-nucleotide adenylyltransferase [Rickettsiales bacterium]|nr:putative nicotinate-nucleotide adenylyltransferase [Rickettsiales bacterium]
MLSLIKTNSRLKIGLLGGSFDPPHVGHLEISLQAIKKLNLNQIWWLITPQNPLKPEPAELDIFRRKKLAISLSKNSRIVVTDVEKKLRSCYTVNTIYALKKRFPNYKFIWLMGIDNLLQFHNWKRWQDIAKSTPILAFDRGKAKYKATNSKAAIFTNRAINARMLLHKKSGWHLFRIRRIYTSSVSIRSTWKR